MKILFLSHYYWPHIGGVENHVFKVADRLRSRGHNITILTEKFKNNLKSEEERNGIRIRRLKYPHKKYIGLLYIWKWMWSHREIISESDIIHCHDVFIWYLPFRMLFPNKPVYTTVHGLEWVGPFSKNSFWQKKIAVKLSAGSIGVGRFLEKQIGVKFNEIIYGGMEPRKKTGPKIKNSIVYVGRLEEDTGLGKFLEWLKTYGRNPKLDFCGDGLLRSECEKFGSVHGFCNPRRYYEKAETCVPGGFLAYLEAKSYGCKIKLFWNDQLKKEYWEEVKKIRKFPTWEGIAKLYENQYLHNRN